MKGPDGVWERLPPGWFPINPPSLCVSGALLSVEWSLAQRIVLSKVYARLGGRLRHATTGGASISPAVKSFFGDIGIPIIEVRVHVLAYVCAFARVYVCAFVHVYVCAYVYADVWLYIIK